MWHGICYFCVAEYTFEGSVSDNDKSYCKIMNAFSGFSSFLCFQFLYLANKKVQEKLDNLFLKGNPFKKNSNADFFILKNC